MTRTLIRCSRVLEIVGDILRIRLESRGGEAGSLVHFGDLAMVENIDGRRSLAQVIGLSRSTVTLQVMTGTKGFSTRASVRLLGHSMQVTYFPNILGRVFIGDSVHPRHGQASSMAVGR